MATGPRERSGRLPDRRWLWGVGGKTASGGATRRGGGGGRLGRVRGGGAAGAGRDESAAGQAKREVRKGRIKGGGAIDGWGRGRLWAQVVVEADSGGEGRARGRKGGRRLASDGLVMRCEDKTTLVGPTSGSSAAGFSR
jgi:hypothetical protein